MKKSLIALIMTISTAIAEGKISYEISFPNANLHYTDVAITLKTKGADYVEFSMPVWTPGSYKLREFSQYVDRATAVDEDGNELSFEKTNKNTWRVESKSAKKVTFSYEVYNFVISVRHSYVDDHYAFIHGVSTFMRVNGRDDEKIDLNVVRNDNWEASYAALPKSSNGNTDIYEVENFDLLADSPIAIGNFDHVSYTSGEVEHQVVMIGKGEYDLAQVKEDFKKVSDTEVDIFGEHPSSPIFIHFIQNVASGGGGLEHLNCQTSQVVRSSYKDKVKYRNFVRLVAHEQFHLWNVKRIRPIELGPFDYDTENYTKQLWVAEGITSYYDDHILLRNGLHTRESYIESVEHNINRLQNSSGRKIMDLEESSFNAWVKLYLSNENSTNTSISYYNKGMLVAMIIDLEVIKQSNGKRSFDDILQKLYAFYKKEDRGFSIDEFWTMANEAAGFDLKNIYDKYITSTAEIPYNQFFNYVGMQITDENAKEPKSSLGISTKSDNGKCIISSVQIDGIGAKSGLSANDEIIAINGFRVEGTAQEDIENLTVGETAEVLVARDGIMYTYEVPVTNSNQVDFKLKDVEKITDEQKRLQAYWLSDRKSQ